MPPPGEGGGGRDGRDGRGSTGAYDTHTNSKAKERSFMGSGDCFLPFSGNLFSKTYGSEESNDKGKALFGERAG
jgi:hypothetical protein